MAPVGGRPEEPLATSDEASVVVELGSRTLQGVANESCLSLLLAAPMNYGMQVPSKRVEMQPHVTPNLYASDWGMSPWRSGYPIGTTRFSTGWAEVLVVPNQRAQGIPTSVLDRIDRIDC